LSLPFEMLRTTLRMARFRPLLWESCGKYVKVLKK